MRKHMILATLIGFCALSVTACQRGEDKPAAPAGGTTAEQTMPANPSSDTMNTAANDSQTEQQQPMNNGTQDLAASGTSNTPGNGMQPQATDNNQGAMGSSNATQTPTTGTTAPSTPSDQSGAAMQGSAPDNASTPSEQTPSTGDGSMGAPTGTETTPPTGSTMENKPEKSNTDTGSSMSSDQPGK